MSKATETAAAAAAPAAAVPIKSERPVRLHGKGFGVSSFKFNRWSAELDEKQTIEQALQPQFWADVAGQIMGHDKANPRGRGDVIELRKLDSGLYAELLVVAIGPGFVRVVPIMAYQPQDVSAPESAALTTKYNPSKKVHEVIRRDDSQVLQSGFQVKADAVAWIDEHLKTLKAA